MPLTIKIPGKLYIAGEYAVLNPGNPAILIGIDAYLSCQIKPHPHQEILVFSDGIRENGPLVYQLDAPLHINLSSQWAYVQASLQVVNQYLKETNLTLRSCQIDLKSDLTQDDGLKYGLGSSGAVTLAIIKGLLAFHQIQLDGITYFKLAAIASMAVSDKGSLGDLAASSFGGWIYYQSLDRDWLKTILAKKLPLTSILNLKWPKLLIRPLQVDPHFQVHIGWTQTPASTDQLVSQFETSETHLLDVQALYETSKKNVDQIGLALERGDYLNLDQVFREARTILSHWSRLKHIQIETPSLTRLIEIAQAHHLPAKTSGAGGGDCGIAISYHADSSLVQSLNTKWEEASILPLPFHPIQN